METYKVVAKYYADSIFYNEEENITLFNYKKTAKISNIEVNEEIFPIAKMVSFIKQNAIDIVNNKKLGIIDDNAKNEFIEYIEDDNFSLTMDNLERTGCIQYPAKNVEDDEPNDVVLEICWKLTTPVIKL